MSNLLLAIDQGTSGCKISVFDTEGHVIACVTRAYATYYPQAGFVEQNPEEWWEAIVYGIKEVLKHKDINPKRIQAIGTTGTSWACIPIDRKGAVLYPAMIWLDRRAYKEAEWMKTVVDEQKLIELSGNPVDPAYITPKMLWLKKHKEKIYRQTYKFLQSNAYITYCLTGEISQDYSQGYGFHFFNIKTLTWEKTIADQLGLDLDLMAPLMPSHEIVGVVTKEVAQLTGLTLGTPVVAGGLDAACCTLGAGVIERGQTQEQGGQAGGMSIVLTEPKVHPKLILGTHVVPNRWLMQGGTTGGGGTLKWFHKTLDNQGGISADLHEKNPYESMSKDAASVAVGSEGLIFLPYMKGERSPLWNSHAKGVYYGLSYDKTKAHLIRSMMEGVAFSLLHNLETAEETGVMVGALRSVGGSANSATWTQIKADVTGKRIEVAYTDYATGLGAAILAGVGVGLYNDFHEAIERTVQVKTVYTPNINDHQAYQSVYQTYIKLSKILEKEFWQ